MANAHRMFVEAVDRLWFEPDRVLYRELCRSCALSYLNEQRLVDRLAHGADILLRERDGLYDADDPLWQRWLLILTAWHACHEAMEEDKREQPPATESVALKPKARLIEFSLGKAH